MVEAVYTLSSFTFRESFHGVRDLSGHCEVRVGVEGGTTNRCGAPRRFSGSCFRKSRCRTVKLLSLTDNFLQKTYRPTDLVLSSYTDLSVQVIIGPLSSVDFYKI